MRKQDKLVSRLLAKPKDFTWWELIKLLSELEYEQAQSGKTSGSRARFVHHSFAPICLHKPHPEEILKGYQNKAINPSFER